MAESVDSLRKLVSCSVCFEPYNDPRILQCGHSFCKECIRQYAKTQGRVECPECHSKMRTKVRSVDTIKENFGLKPILEKLADTGEAQPICREHQEILSVFCSSCHAIICVGCCNTHEGHAIGSINKEFEKVQTVLRKAIDDVKATAHNVASVVKNRDSYWRKINTNTEGILMHVDRTFKELQTKLEERRVKIRQSIEERMARLKQTTLHQKLQYKQRRDQLLNQIDACNELLSKTKAHVLKDYNGILRSAEDSLETVPSLPLSDALEEIIPSGDINCSWAREAITRMEFCWKDGILEEWECYQRKNTSAMELIKRIEKDNVSMQTESTKLISEKRAIETELMKSSDTNKQLHQCLDSRERDIAQLQQKLQKEQENHQIAVSKVTKLEQTLQSKERDIAHLLQKQQKEQENLQQLQQVLQRIEQEKKSLADSLKAETVAKDDALQRLSKLASNKLLDNNQDITDLSDSNRPIKLAEKMMELYHNEWADAYYEFEEHMEKKDEAACAHALLKILKVVYEQSLNTSAEQLKSIMDLMMCPIKSEAGVTTNAIASMPQVQQVQKNVTEQRKSLFVTTIKQITPILSKYVEDHETNEDHKKLLSKEEVKEYVDKCVEICWLMAIQGTPLSLGWGTDGNGHFDTSLFREYTKKGDMIDFVVWPVLYLHEGGPLLAKGIAQGKKKE